MLLVRFSDDGSTVVHNRTLIQSKGNSVNKSALDTFEDLIAAIDTYFICRNKLSEELGLDPSVETRALYDEILAMEDKPRVIPLDPLVD